MVSFRGKKELGPRPDRSLLGVKFKISDKHPHPFHMRSPHTSPPPSQAEAIDPVVCKSSLPCFFYTGFLLPLIDVSFVS